MKTSVFVSFCALVMALILALHGLFKSDFGAIDKLKEKLVSLDRERERTELRAQLVAHQIAEYKSHVALLLPESLDEQNVAGGELRNGPTTELKSFNLRQIASVVGEGGDSLAIERASGFLERAKASFREKDYEGAISLLKNLLSSFPDSTHVPTAYFLLSECHYQAKDYPEAVASIEKLIEMFPENELTGFALLRLGHIFEIQDRLEDASDVYKSVLTNFKQPDLVQQATQSLKAVRL